MPASQFFASIDQQDGSTAYLVQSDTGTVSLTNVALNAFGRHWLMAHDGQGTWVAAGPNTAGASTSTDDGATFSPIPALSGLSIGGLIWDGARFVALVHRTVWWSWDGVNWTQGPSDAIGTNPMDVITGLAFFKGVYVTIQGSSGGRLWYTDDLHASTWTMGDSFAPPCAAPFVIATSDSLLVVAGLGTTDEAGVYLTDPTGSWSACTFSGTPFGGGDNRVRFYAPVWTGSSWVSGGQRHSAAQMGYHTSADGMSWTRATDATGGSFRLGAAAWDGSHVWFAAWDATSPPTDDRAIFSWNGTTWTRYDFDSMSGSVAPLDMGIAVYPDPTLPAGARGHVYLDPNLDGSWAGGPAAGVTVELYQDTDHNGSFETLVASVITAADGEWVFPDLEQSGGDYQVRLVPPAGYNATQTIAFTFTTAGGVDEHDFGIAEWAAAVIDASGVDVQPPLYADSAVVDAFAGDASPVLTVETGVVEVFGVPAAPSVARVRIIEETIGAG